LTAKFSRWGGQFFMAKTNRINKISVICNSVMVITPILPLNAGNRTGTEPPAVIFCSTFYGLYHIHKIHAIFFFFSKYNYFFYKTKNPEIFSLDFF
jgi:hypothetical protein